MQRITLSLSSDPAVGATNLSADGSSFEVTLNGGRGLSIPASAKIVEIALVQASIWNVSYNISPEFGNNLLPFTTGGIPRTIAVPAGLWSLSALNTYLGTQFVSLGLSSSLFRLSGLDATNQTAVTFENGADIIDFTGLGTLRTVFGFNARLVTVGGAGQTAYSDEAANFNRNNAYLITSNLCEGLQINANSSGVLGIVPISSAPGTLINWEPRQILWIPCRELASHSKQNLRFALVNQSLMPTPTGGEYNTFTIVLRYQ